MCSSVAIKPKLQFLTAEVLWGNLANRGNGPRLDIAFDGFWNPGKEKPSETYVSLTLSLLPTKDLLWLQPTTSMKNLKRDPAARE